MSIEVRNLSKKFGTFAALQRRQPAMSQTGELSRCSAPPAPARQRCCESSRG